MCKWRKCVFGCEKFMSLFGLPRDGTIRKKWLELIFSSTRQSIQKLYVCDRHFSEDCLANLGQYQSGLAGRLNLKTGAIPTIKLDGEAKRAGTSKESSTEAVPVIFPLVRSIGVQTTPTSALTRTVSTQSIAGTLKLQHAGVQAAATTTVKSTEAQHWLNLSSASIKASTSGPGPRPTKRPRLEEEEEKEADFEDMDISEDILPHDSSYEPRGSTTEASTLATCFTDVSEVIEKDPTAMDDAKYIVFEKSLKEIFDTCPVCQRHCIVKKGKYGTLVSFTQKCPRCQYSRKWQSGPVIGSTPVGNLQLSAAVYFAGGSFVKFARICNAINLQIHQYNTFRRHARCYLEPAVYHKWNEDQKILFENLKKRGKIAVSGDMKANSPGCSAKYGTYTLMDLESDKIVAMELIQSNEVGGSSHMEKEGLRRSLDFLEANGLEVDYIVTDRHPQIQKFLRERDVTQYYDVWHFVKGLSKKLNKLAKDQECQIIKKWLAAIKNHMYWTASSSKSGPKKVAKWVSLLNHIQDIHSHDDPLLTKCAHPDKVSRDPKKWFHPGTKAMYKVEKLLMNKRVLADVAKLSSCQQTSSLASFQSGILRFAPKISDFKYVGMMCRLYLAGMHQNENAKCKQAISKRKALFKVSNPKYKKGQGTAKPIKIETTFGYVASLMHLVFTEIFPDPTKFVAQLKMVPVPEDLCAQFGRSSDEDVIAAQCTRLEVQSSGGCTSTGASACQKPT